MAFCRYCNTELHPNLKFCTKCGKSINFNCIFCGKPVTSGSEYCPECKINVSKGDIIRKSPYPRYIVLLSVLVMFVSGGFFFMANRKFHREIICGFSSNSNEIVFVDKNTKEIYKKIKSHKLTGPMVFNNNNIYVAGGIAGITLIDVFKNEQSCLNINEHTLNMIISKDGSMIYATNPVKNTLLFISLPEGQLMASVKAGSVPSGLVLDDYSKMIYVANYKSNDITVIDTSNMMEKSIIKEVGNGPYKLLLVRDCLYSLNYLSNDVALINTSDNSIVKKITSGNKPLDMVMANDKKSIYVANLDSSSISIINSEIQSVVKEIKLNGKPLCLGLSPDGNILVSVKGGMGNKIISINHATFSLKDEINTGEYQIANFVDVILNN